MIGWKVLRGLAPACLDGRTGRETFETIAVIRTDAGERIPRKIVRDADMSHFRVRGSVDHAVSGDGSAANACADREINEIRNALRRAPASFTQRGRVDV